MSTTFNPIVRGREVFVSVAEMKARLQEAVDATHEKMRVLLPDSPAYAARRDDLNREIQVYRKVMADYDAIFARSMENVRAR